LEFCIMDAKLLTPFYEEVKLKIRKAQ